MSKKFMCVLILLVSCGSKSTETLSLVDPLNSISNGDESQADDSLVTIESDYEDLSSAGQWVTVKGSGFLISDSEKTYILTASHVSQGKNLKVKWREKNLTITGSYYDGLSDVEVLETNAPVSSSIKLLGKNLVWAPSDSVRRRWVDEKNFTLLNTWVVDPHLSLDNKLAQKQKDQIYCDYYCVLLQAQSLFQPGSSGSPLVYNSNGYDFESGFDFPLDVREGTGLVERKGSLIRGVVIRRNRFFARSSLVPISRAIQILDDYKNGKRTEAVPATHWNLSSGLLFRINKRSGLHESAVVSGGSGNGISMDGGGLSELNENNPNQVLQDVSTFPVTNGESRTHWLFAFRSPINSQFMSIFSWFDMEHENIWGRFQFSLSPPDEENSFENFFTYRTQRKVLNQYLYSREGKAALRKGESGEIFVKIERTEFSLTKGGALCIKNKCATRFQPVIEVPNHNGGVYIVDIRSLFFLVPEMASTTSFRDPKIFQMDDKEWIRYQYESIENEFQIIRIFWREKIFSKDTMTLQEGSAVSQSWVL